MWFQQVIKYVLEIMLSDFEWILGAMKCLYKEGLSTPYMHINDAWISGYVREKCGYRVRHFNSLKLMKVKQQTANHSFWLASQFYYFF